MSYGLWLFHNFILICKVVFFYLPVSPESIPRTTKPTVSSALDLSETTLGNSKKFFSKTNKTLPTLTEKKSNAIPYLSPLLSPPYQQ